MAGGGATNSTGPPPQAGVLEGINPIAYNPSNPITLFIIQVSNPIGGPVRPEMFLDPSIGAG